VVIAGLIILGGLGFYVIFDLYHNRRNLSRRFFKKLRLHTRVVLFMSTLLIIVGTVFIFGLEYSNSLKSMSLKGKLMASIFQAITPRTAGFNTIPIGDLSNATLFLIVIMMFIGASPGSTGGGIKTSTFACVMASVFARFRMQEDANIFYRRIPGAIVSRAISVVFFSGFIIMIFTMLILISESYALPHSKSSLSYLEYLFEVVSAFGTVGLSTGVTAQLTDLGKILITLVMFIGRVGPLTIALAVKGEETVSRYKYVQEAVLVG
jgi:trk system potassium uptake protein TrkH